MRKPLIARAIALFLLLTGCATPSRRLEVASVRQVQTGMTRQAVEQKIGFPKQSISGPAGQTVAHYDFHQFIVSNEASPQHRRLKPGRILIRTLSVLYNGNGTVVKKLHDESVTDVYQNGGWMEVGTHLDNGGVARSVTTGATIDQLILLLGEPTRRLLDANGNIRLIWINYRDRLDYLGKPECRALQVRLDEQNRAVDYELLDSDPLQWSWR